MGYFVKFSSFGQDTVTHLHFTHKTSLFLNYIITCKSEKTNICLSCGKTVYRQTSPKTRQNSSSDHCAAEQPFRTGNEAPTGLTCGQRTSLRTRNQCFPCKVLCPDETHTFPEWNWLFLGTQSRFVSHIWSTIPLCRERLASYQSTPDLLNPSYPCWKQAELPVTALAQQEILLGC